MQTGCRLTKQNIVFRTLFAPSTQDGGDRERRAILERLVDACFDLAHQYPLYPLLKTGSVERGRGKAPGYFKPAHEPLTRPLRRRRTYMRGAPVALTAISAARGG